MNCNKHLFIENVITGDKEYILSFSESITIGQNSVIQGQVFRLRVSDSREIELPQKTFNCVMSGNGIYAADNYFHNCQIVQCKPNQP